MKYRIAYDVKNCKVGCVLIQAAMGGTMPSKLFHELFPSEAWTVKGNNCQVYEITDEQLPILVAKTNMERIDG